MKKTFILLSAFLATTIPALFADDFNRQTYHFHWADPTSLNPSYPSPSSTNRRGDDIGGEEFVCGPVSVSIDDANVSNPENKARFMYGTTSYTVEMRAYPGSIVTVSVKGEESIETIEWTDVNANTVIKLEYLPDNETGLTGTFRNNVWRCAEEYVGTVHEVRFEVIATLNSTNTAVTTVRRLSDESAVIDPEKDSDVMEEWFTLQGLRMVTRPTLPGIYLQRTGNGIRKTVIR